MLLWKHGLRALCDENRYFCVCSLFFFQYLFIFIYVISRKTHTRYQDSWLPCVKILLVVQVMCYRLCCRYSLKSIDPVLMAPTCVFLASKVEVWELPCFFFLHELTFSQHLWLFLSHFCLFRNLELFRIPDWYRLQLLCVSNTVDWGIYLILI